MFRGLWRALNGEARELAILEIALVTALYLIPALGVPLVPVVNGGAEQSENHQTCEKNRSNCEGVFVWGARGAGAFIDAYHDDINASSTMIIGLFTIVLAVSTIGLWRVTAETLDIAASKNSVAREVHS